EPLASLTCLLRFACLQGPAGEGPAEGLRKHLVEVRDETRQLVLQVGRGGEAATSNRLAHDHAKDDLNLIQPRRVLGQVHEANAVVPVRQKPLPRRLRLQHARFAFFFPTPRRSNRPGTPTAPTFPRRGCSSCPRRTPTMPPGPWPPSGRCAGRSRPPC